MTDFRKAEQACLEATLARFHPGELVLGHPKRIDRIYLKGDYPETRLVAEGDHTRAGGGPWIVSLPIWRLTNHERPNISEIERLMYIGIIEA